MTTDHNGFVDKARATGMFDNLRAGFSEIAALRASARDAGLQLPEDIQRSVASMRETLRAAGLPQALIDATPGLEP